MRAAEVIAKIRHQPVSLASIFHILANALPDCTTSDGLRLLDQSDFAQWLRELAEEAEK